MSITFKDNIFYLNTPRSSYLISLFKGKYLVHMHYGGKITSDITELESLRPTMGHCFSVSDDENDDTYSTDVLPQEYPCFGSCDLRTPAFHAEYSDKSRITRLVYKTHRIFGGKSSFKGLPSSYVSNRSEADSLEIDLTDHKKGLLITLCYTVFNNHDIISRSVRIKNTSDEKIKLERAFSANIDFWDADFDLLHLHGSWARERHIARNPLFFGTQSIESKRGASSHMHNPFIALLRKDTTENQGEAYGISLVYSGNFIMGTEVDQFSVARTFAGINSFDFGWQLERDEEFVTPEVLLSYSNEGLGGMSGNYHKFIREHIIKSKYKSLLRPVLANNWEATYFDFTEEKIISLAKKAKEVGAELMVLDDGWFGNRENDRSSLGDWYENKKRLPKGLNNLSVEIEKVGMSFGLWVEPEMVSPDSDLYRKHPDWCIRIKDYKPSKGRHQLILDLSREDVRAYIKGILTQILSSAKISYIKWDMNRNMTELPTKETAHRYILGLYDILEEITEAFPEILFEGCSGGGGRFDLGILHYMPQIWASDNTDAFERLKIQYGTSLVYPVNTIGAHISEVPNHLTGRKASLTANFHAALTGQLGFEIDFLKLTESEIKLLREATELYKKIAEIIQFGDMYRLLSPFSDNITALQFVSPDKKKTVLCCYSVLARPSYPYRNIKLRGLREDYRYREEKTGIIYGGDTLLRMGVTYVEDVDFKSEIRVYYEIQ